jgi:hypothetical protein
MQTSYFVDVHDNWCFGQLVLERDFLVVGVQGLYILGFAINLIVVSKINMWYVHLQKKNNFIKRPLLENFIQTIFSSKQIELQMLIIYCNDLCIVIWKWKSFIHKIINHFI